MGRPQRRWRLSEVLSLGRGVSTLEERLPGRANSRCKGPEVTGAEPARVGCHMSWPERRAVRPSGGWAGLSRGMVCLGPSGCCEQGGCQGPGRSQAEPQWWLGPGWGLRGWGGSRCVVCEVGTPSSSPVRAAVGPGPGTAAAGRKGVAKAELGSEASAGSGRSQGCVASQGWLGCFPRTGLLPSTWLGDFLKDKQTQGCSGG